VSIFRIIFRDAEIKGRAALQSLGDTVELLRDLEGPLLRRSEFETRILQLIAQLRAHIDAVTPAPQRDQELVELACAQAACGATQEATATFHALGSSDTHQLLRVGVALARAGAADRAVDLALSSASDIAGACRAVRILAELYSDRRVEIVRATVAAARMLLNEMMDAHTPTTSSGT